jgi:small nuclear ribonucleoprotein (snRNP)-like protein
VTAAVVVLSALLVAAVVTAFVLWVRSASALQSRMRSDVIVTLKTGASFAGVLYERDALVMVLRQAVDLQPNNPVPIDGELLVRWAEVDFVQLP